MQAVVPRAAPDAVVPAIFVQAAIRAVVAVQTIVSRFPINPVRSPFAEDGVVTGTSIDDVVIRTTFQVIVTRSANNDVRSRSFVDKVVAAAAVDLIVSIAAPEHVLAAAADQRVVPSLPHHRGGDPGVIADVVVAPIAVDVDLGNAVDVEGFAVVLPRLGPHADLHAGNHPQTAVVFVVDLNRVIAAGAHDVDLAVITELNLRSHQFAIFQGFERQIAVLFRGHGTSFRS